MSIDTLKQALEALTRIWEDGLENFPESAHDNAIDALRLAIEQAERLEKEPTKIFGPGLEEMLNSAGFYKAEKVEPVAWANINKHGDITHTSNKRTAWAKTPLYTAPPQRDPLTEEEFDKIENRVYCRTREKGKPLGVYVRELCRAIERKHGIGGGE